jgi:uncharacterized membrane protein YdjX (TVP38/TMEM64 family)
MPSTGAGRRRIIIFALIICLLLATGGVLIAKGYLTIEWLNDKLDTLEETLNRPYGPVLYVLGTIVFIGLQIPGVVPVILAPLVYGLAESFFLTMIGVNIGMIATFLAARYFLRDYLAPKLEKGRLHRFTRHLETNGILTMSFLRIALWMFPPMNWAIGATNIRIRDYIIGNIIGLAPIIFAIQLVTYRLKSIDSVVDLLRPESIGVILGFVAFLIVVAWTRRRYMSTGESRSREEA